MTAKLTRVLRALYCEPWLVRPEMHQHLCSIAWAHATGSAHDENGIVANFTDDMKRQDNDARIIDGGIAIISVSGVIGRKFSTMLNNSGVTSIDVLDGIISNAIKDASVKAIVLDIDSPGGTVTGVPEAAELIEIAATYKPVVAYTGGMMASAAYWIASAADAIFASKSADVGSIGVYCAYLDVTRKLESEGVDVKLFKQGKFKAMGMPGIPLTEEQETLIQEGVDEIADWFKGYVTSSRPSVSAGAMEGQTYLGKNAVAVGLVDHIGTLDDAIAYAKQEAAQR